MYVTINVYYNTGPGCGLPSSADMGWSDMIDSAYVADVHMTQTVSTTAQCQSSINSSMWYEH
jgi:hypothetical protein